MTTLEEVRKHLAGKHSQQSHTPKSGKTAPKGAGGAGDSIAIRLEAAGVEKIGNHYDFRGAARQGVGVQPKKALFEGRVSIGDWVDEYNPKTGDKVYVQIRDAGPDGYKVSPGKGKRGWEVEYHPHYSFPSRRRR